MATEPIQRQAMLHNILSYFFIKKEEKEGKKNNFVAFIFYT